MALWRERDAPAELPGFGPELLTSRVAQAASAFQEGELDQVEALILEIAEIIDRAKALLGVAPAARLEPDEETRR